jgi:SPP1 family predicted phage head-tail adaptor
MQAGKLRHDIEIQSLVPVQDGTTGEITDTWQTFATVKAEVRPATVREMMAANISQSKATGKVVVRYVPGVKASMRILFRDRALNIEGVYGDSKSGIEYQTFDVSEVRSG